MKIQCYMPVFNEADILPHTLQHLREQGCLTHVIEGWSTDGSYEIAQRQADSCERFPGGGPDPIQNCTAILERIEHLAEASDADWILYSDADEWRRSAVAGETLAQSAERVQSEGFNAIDFQPYAFFCTDDKWDCRVSPEEYFRFYNLTDPICRLPNRKMWRNIGRVRLVGGGHWAEFPGVKVYPQKFPMRHFPFRTPAQAKQKLETRIERRCQAEYAVGWGSHYDLYGPPYCWDQSKLIEWKDISKPLP